MKTSRFILASALLASLLSPAVGQAEDIDIYSTGGGTATIPNVLIILDNAAAWNGNIPGTCTYYDGTTPSLGNTTAGGNEQCALANVINALSTNADGSARVNLGLMVFGNSSNNGGLLKQQIIGMSSTNKSTFINVVKGFQTPADQGNASQIGATMQESWAYFTGGTGISGTNYSGINPAPGCQKNFIVYIANTSTQGKPQDSGSAPVQADLNSAIDAAVTAGVFTSTQAAQLKTQINAGTKYDSNWGDEWARFMSQADANGTFDGNQSIVTYTISVFDPSKENADYVNFAASMANHGGGKAFTANTYNDIVQALLKILNEVLAVNSVFASSSLPVSVNTQGTYLNQIFMGMFRPDGNGNPRWTGNLKQYQFVYNAGTLQLADSLAQPIINPSTGFISPNAVSFWTTKNTAVAPDSTGGFWINNPQGAGLAFDSPDGEVVEKGGAAQQLRIANLTDNYSTSPASPRKLYTYCPGGSGCNSALSDASNAFATTNANINLGAASQFTTSLSAASNTVTAGSNNSLSPGDPVTISGCTGTLAGTVNGLTFTVTSATSTSFQFLANATSGTATGCTVTPKTTLTSLINWMRGQDNNSPSDELGPGGTVTVRPSIHADVVHSRPAAINYGGSTGVVVFYGANDGVYHAVNGNQTSSIGSMPPGGELWGFIPPEFFGKLKRLRNDNPMQLLPSTPAGILPTPQKKDYFSDGSTGVYQNGSTVYIYFAQRRGGRFIYALDVSDPTAPHYLWKKGCYPNGTCDPGFGEIGQTWSQPKVALVQGYKDGSGNPKPVLIFGAGYDASAEDAEPPTADTMGRGIFILDATDGHMIWQAQPQPSGSTSCSGTPVVCNVAGMNYSIPADITLVDRNYDGFIDRLYAADVGGNVWRVDLEPTAGNTPDHWTVTQLAALGCWGGVCASGTTPRKFLFPPDVVPTATYDAVLIGSGDREQPLYSTAENSAYSKINRFYMLKDTNTGNDGSNLQITHSGLYDATTSLYDGSLHGYYITLGTGEKVVNAPLTVAGYTYFGTNQPSVPSATSCTSSLGTARGYAVQFNTGTASATVFTGGGLPPSPIAGLVNVNVNGTNQLVPFLIGGGSGGGASGGSGGCAGADCNSQFGAQKPPINPGTSRKRTYWYQELDK